MSPNQLLLADFLTSRLTLPQLAAHHNLSLPELLAWADSPEVVKLLADFTRIALRRAEVIAADISPGALSSLSAISASAIPHTIESRRVGESTRKACAALLRHCPKPAPACSATPDIPETSKPDSSEPLAPPSALQDTPTCDAAPTLSASEPGFPAPEASPTFHLRLTPRHPSVSLLQAAAGGVPP